MGKTSQMKYVKRVHKKGTDLVDFFTDVDTGGMKIMEEWY